MIQIRSVWIPLIVFGALILEQGIAHALTPGEIVRANKDAVVYLRVTGTDQNGVPREADATGFLVSPDGHIITVVHILRDENGREIEGASVEGAPGSRYDPFRLVEILVKDTSADLMLLKFRGNRDDYNVVSICNQMDLELGDDLVTLGYPKDSELSVVAGILSSTSGDRGLYQTNTDFIEGYSGGPVFDSKTGSVAGVVMSGTAGVAGRNFFAPISDSNNLLDRVPRFSLSNCSYTSSNRMAIREVLSGIEILYFTKERDTGRVERLLKEHDIRYRTSPSGSFFKRHKTNALVCSQNIDPSAIKELALLLYDSGIGITNIDEGDGNTTLSNQMNLEACPYDVPLLSRNEIENLDFCPSHDHPVYGCGR